MHIKWNWTSCISLSPRNSGTPFSCVPEAHHALRAKTIFVPLKLKTFRSFTKEPWVCWWKTDVTGYNRQEGRLQPLKGRNDSTITDKKWRKREVVAGDSWLRSADVAVCWPDLFSGDVYSLQVHRSKEWQISSKNYLTHRFSRKWNVTIFQCPNSQLIYNVLTYSVRQIQEYLLLILHPSSIWIKIFEWGNKINQVWILYSN